MLTIVGFYSGIAIFLGTEGILCIKDKLRLPFVVWVGCIILYVGPYLGFLLLWPTNSERMSGSVVLGILLSLPIAFATGGMINRKAKTRTTSLNQPA